MTLDLNDLRYFALVVEHGGFSAAERHAHIGKSKLSRRIALLEERLGVRLLQRSTRRLALTEAGRVFHDHCAAMLVEAESAGAAVAQLRSEPAGTVRLTCPVGMAHFYVARLIADYLQRHPKVRVELDSSDRMVNLIEERIDIALRARDGGLSEPGLVAVRLGAAQLVLVAAPAYLHQRSVLADPSQLPQHATIGTLAGGAEQVWPLVNDAGGQVRQAVRPRLLCSDFAVQHQAALQGVGVALLPLRIARPSLDAGALQRVAGDWATAAQNIHLVFATRRGMLPAVRSLVDYLIEHVPAELDG